jgi:hypothetical protein
VQTIAAGMHGIEIQSHERCLQARQQPRYNPFESYDRWLFVDSVGPAGNARRWFLSIDRHGRGLRGVDPR